MTFGSPQLAASLMRNRPHRPARIFPRPVCSTNKPNPKPPKSPVLPQKQGFCPPNPISVFPNELNPTARFTFQEFLFSLSHRT
jgi:hypothetical protein